MQPENVEVWETLSGTAHSGDDGVGRELLKGLVALWREQLPTGEIATYQRDHAGDLAYCRSPFISTFVHDTLGYFDPRSPWLQPSLVTVVPASERRWFVRTVTRIRHRIRPFIAWQAESTRTWRFFGRGSGLAPDVDTTACAAATLLESARADLVEHWQPYVNALKRFRSSEGLYFTWVDPDDGGYSWMDEYGRRIPGYDRVVNANVLRALALAGEDVSAVAAYLLKEAAGGALQTGSLYYPNPLSFFYMLARAWRQAQLPGLDELADICTPQILSRQDESGGFGGPLSTAMALSALLDLAYCGPALAQGAVCLLKAAQPWGGWAYEDFFSDRILGYGAPAWTAALAILVLARCHLVTEFEL